MEIKMQPIVKSAASIFFVLIIYLYVSEIISNFEARKRYYSKIELCRR